VSCTRWDSRALRILAFPVQPGGPLRQRPFDGGHILAVRPAFVALAEQLDGGIVSEEPMQLPPVRLPACMFKTPAHPAAQGRHPHFQ
jgi:hypothetical protein